MVRVLRGGVTEDAVTELLGGGDEVALGRILKVLPANQNEKNIIFFDRN